MRHAVNWWNELDKEEVIFYTILGFILGCGVILTAIYLAVETQ